MFEHLLSEEQIQIRDQAREFVKSIPRQMIVDMDQDKIKFPKEFLQEAGRLNLMGCRYPKEWGGRGLDWVATAAVMEEIGVLGYIFACTFGVGAEAFGLAANGGPLPLSALGQIPQWRPESEQYRPGHDR